MHFAHQYLHKLDKHVSGNHIATSHVGNPNCNNTTSNRQSLLVSNAEWMHFHETGHHTQHHTSSPPRLQLQIPTLTKSAVNDRNHRSVCRSSFTPSPSIVRCDNQTAGDLWWSRRAAEKRARGSLAGAAFWRVRASGVRAIYFGAVADNRNTAMRSQRMGTIAGRSNWARDWVSTPNWQGVRYANPLKRVYLLRMWWCA